MTYIHNTTGHQPAQEADPTATEPAAGSCSHGPPRHRIRALTLTRRKLAVLNASEPPLTRSDIAARAARPKTWGECRGRSGPCPWVGCPAHLWLDVNPTNGSVKLNHPGLAGPEDLDEPCALRLATAGPAILEVVAERMNVTRERLRQIQIRALAKMEVVITEEGKLI